MPLIKYDPPPTGRLFMNSDAEMRVLMGPVGSGKSVTSSVEIVRRAMEQLPNSEGRRKTRWAVIRQTTGQLNDTTIKTFCDWFPPHACGTFKLTTNTYMIIFTMDDGTTVECEVLFRPLDRPEDVAKLNSLEVTGAWFNECRDMKSEIINSMSKRIGRYPSMKDGGPTWTGMWGDTNPPIIGSWWYYQMEGIDPRDGYSPNDNGWHVFKQPSGRSAEAENLENLRPGYYDTRGRDAEYIRVFIDGQYGLSSTGKPVFKNFNADYHLSKGPINYIKSQEQPIVIGVDLGMTPAAVLLQQDSRGRVMVLDEIQGDDGTMQFCVEKLKPLLARKYFGMPVQVVCDPAGGQRSQNDGRSAISIIKKLGLPVMPASTNSIIDRVEAVDECLRRVVDGDPGFQLDPGCRKLLAAMRGGYRYHKTEEKIIKDGHSHIADALQYGMLGIGRVSGAFMTVEAREVMPVECRGWT